jgi:hypothetical protein
MSYTAEQESYIINPKKSNTRLIACAGSGKTKCIIQRCIFLIKKNIFSQISVLILTFSHFTQNDFVRRLSQDDSEGIILRDNVKTIDAYAKYILESLSEKKTNIDVSMLSHNFMMYLKNSSKVILKENPLLKKIKTIFIDEAQDLNPTQYEILYQLYKKLNIKINLIGDPNQTIFQFRNASETYLMNFSEKVLTFYLTTNFRSSKSIVKFSSFLRPYQDIQIKSHRKSSKIKPTFHYVKDEKEIEKELIKLLLDAKEANIDFSEIALLCPTRGHMKAYNKSNGLCLLTNILYKNSIKFLQFYEETSEETFDRIPYTPKSRHLNLLTYTGSKGLEWNYVIIFDANMSLINKVTFNETAHQNERYLLYVACSRAIKHLCIFTNYSLNYKTNKIYHDINNWFEIIPPSLYDKDDEMFQKINYKTVEQTMIKDFSPEIERRITKIIDILLPEDLEKICLNIDFNQISKSITKLYSYDIGDSESNTFLGKFTEELFHSIYSIKKGQPKKTFTVIENILSYKTILRNVSKLVEEWYKKNRLRFDWTRYDTERETIPEVITLYIDKNFDRNIKFSEHMIINNYYYELYISQNKEWIRNSYEKYLECTDSSSLKKYLFNLQVILSAIESQHYYHIKSKGEKLRYILTKFNDLFDKIISFVESDTEEYSVNNQLITGFDLIGEIDLETTSGDIVEIKCVRDINLKHILQVLMYNLMKKPDLLENPEAIILRFINLFQGERVAITINTISPSYKEIVNLFMNATK